jgi:hypothetical protein
MGKRSSFERVPRDFYPTPYEAVIPLLPHLSPHTPFIEPCAGDGALWTHLECQEHTCVRAFDIEPKGDVYRTGDATMWQGPRYDATCFITNPPWDRKILHPIITNLSAQLPTWLLFDADWMHTRQSAAFVPLLRKIVSVGRVKWIPDSKMTGKDNCCWYLFDANKTGPVEFVGR